MYTRNYVQEGGGIQLGKSEPDRTRREGGGAAVKWTDAEDIGIALFEKFPDRRSADGAIHRSARESAGARRVRRRSEGVERAQARGHPDGLVRRMEGKPVGEPGGRPELDMASDCTCGRDRAHRRFSCSAWLAAAAAQSPAPDQAQSQRSARRRRSTPASWRLQPRADSARSCARRPSVRTYDGLNLRYYVDVFAQAPPHSALHAATTTCSTARCRYGGPSHREMMNMITPQEFRAPVIDFSGSLRWFANKAKKNSGSGSGSGRGAPEPNLPEP